jgi:hypothetical protein
MGRRNATETNLNGSRALERREGSRAATAAPLSPLTAFERALMGKDTIKPMV